MQSQMHRGCRRERSANRSFRSGAVGERGWRSEPCRAAAFQRIPGAAAWTGGSDAGHNLPTRRRAGEGTGRSCGSTSPELPIRSGEVFGVRMTWWSCPGPSLASRRLTQTLRRTVKEIRWSARQVGGDLQERCLALLKSQQIARLVVRNAVDPAAVEDADPFEGEGSESGLVLHAASLAAGVEGVRPKGARDGLAHPLDEGLAEE